MKNVTIAQRIQLMIGASVLALLLVGFAGLIVANNGTDSIKKINDESLAQIQTLDAGSWFGPEFAGEPVPTLEEFLTLPAYARLP